MGSLVRSKILGARALVLAVLLIAGLRVSLGQQGDAAQQAAAPKKARVVGVVKTVSGNTVTLTTDAGTEASVVIQPTTRLVRMAPVRLT